MTSEKNYSLSGPDWQILNLKRKKEIAAIEKNYLICREAETNDLICPVALKNK